MNDATWRHMWGLFHEALERPVAERAPFVAAACGGDADLRRELDELLAAHEGAQANGVDGPLATRGSAVGGMAAEASGSRLGPYRLLGELGCGGMGVVYLGERVDGEVEQQVAVKILPRGMETDDGLQRFRQERQILARLDHPNIARLLDAGTTADGRPYFVMERVEGEPIDRFCSRGRLPLEARLELVRTVCSAVHAAHQNLVVHRDLKPGNILVTPDGEPKLLDFGIAKLLAGGPGAGAPPTIGPWRPMTPEYASPEQVRGEAVTTASDVYALGVLLYELLTGVHPYRLAETPSSRAVRDGEPRRPSTAASRRLRPPAAGETLADQPDDSPQHWAKRLRGDLDAIVLTAMHPDRARRYASAEELARDLDQYLRGLPVRARPDTVRYRTGKFVRRHRLGVAAAMLFVLLLAASATTFAVQSVRLDRQRLEAEQERRRAERVSGFLVELFEVSNPSRAKGEAITARELLDRGAQRIATGLDDEPTVRAELTRTIGKVYESLGLYDEAARLLEESLALRRDLRPRNHAELATAISDLAIVAQLRGDYVSAERWHREALAIRRALFGADAPEVAQSLNALAVMLHEAGEYDRSESCYRQALAMQRAAYGEESWQVSQLLGNLGWLLHDSGHFDEAEPLYRRALELNRQLLGDEHRWVAKSLSNLALLAHDRGDLAAAERAYLEAWGLDARLIEEADHPELAIHVHNRARLAHDRGDLARAEELYRRALAMRRRALSPDHPALATSLAGLGRLLTDRGEPAAAEPLLRQALAIRQAALAPGNWHRAEVESLLGACLLAQGRRTEAAELLAGSLAVIEAQRGRHDLRARQARRRWEALAAAG